MASIESLFGNLLTSASSGISKFFTGVLVILIIAGLIGIIWYIINLRKYNIIIRGHDRRGDIDFEFNDKAKEIITYNKSKLKLLKRKKANIIIPNLGYYRSMITGARVIHVFKVGAVNDYVVLDPKIVMDVENTPVYDDDGTQLKDEKGKLLFVSRPKYELHITESLGKEHAVLDLRNALTRFTQQSKVEKYGVIIAVIIVALVFLISAWIYGHYMLKSANINLQSVQIASDQARQILETINAIRGGGIT